MPRLYLDALNNIHYTVIHLETLDGRPDPVVFMIKFRGAEWLKAHDGVVGDPFPGWRIQNTFRQQVVVSQSWTRASRSTRSTARQSGATANIGKDDEAHYLLLRFNT